MLIKRFPRLGDPFNREITLLYGTRQEIDRRRKALCPDGHTGIGDVARAEWYCYTADDHMEHDYICMVKGASTGNQFIATLSHEVLHCVINAFRFIDLPLTKDSEEAYTYYHNWLFMRLLDVLPRRP